METLGEYKLDADEIVKLLQLECFSVDQKWLIIQSLIVSELSPTHLELGNVISDFILEYGKKISTELFNFLMNTQITVEIKVAVMTRLMNDMESDQIINNLAKLGPPYSEIAERKRPLLQPNELNYKLLDQLILSNIISSYKEDRGAIRVHTKQSMGG
ncbi:hypothetical protein N6H14_16465 [Paenibacillus sp. CC-CFT747]|nr:hypothetical protein N6H14_16465 [Paenibacillus sp. CC-CFT747]